MVFVLFPAVIYLHCLHQCSLHSSTQLSLYDDSTWKKAPTDESEQWLLLWVSMNHAPSEIPNASSLFKLMRPIIILGNVNYSMCHLRQVLFSLTINKYWQLVLSSHECSFVIRLRKLDLALERGGIKKTDVESIRKTWSGFKWSSSVFITLEFINFYQCQVRQLHGCIDQVASFSTEVSVNYSPAPTAPAEIVPKRESLWETKQDYPEAHSQITVQYLQTIWKDKQMQDLV